ncbi:hypothetical protein [Actinomadura rubrisoli]|uniref:Uncharacterized protein n=1 Tax=Actinomadura rubrisoli TaxID=2530368 RepID=A0A4R5CJS5_9ACTN|nr:hypothetical protein [Actinomadura rubrisoli]TDD97672.1 hypothetical protein E1298_01155 [Actinomadura rubrisoli]
MADPPRAAAQITVQLLGEAVLALDNTTQALGISKTDTVNRAVQAYAFLMALQRTGGELYLKHTPDDDLHRFLIHQDPEGTRG